jgi:hypothetical protein
MIPALILAFLAGFYWPEPDLLERPLEPVAVHTREVC